MAGFSFAAAKVKAKAILKGKEAWIYGLDSENAPIANRNLLVMPRGSAVILSAEVSELLELIDKKTKAEGKEIPFFLYGKTKGQTVIIDDIDADIDNLQDTEAVFSPELVTSLEQFVHKSKKDGSDIIVHGHTHPKIGNYFKNFSYGDMSAYVHLKEQLPVFKNSQIEVCSCLIVDGNYNFLFYNGENFYRFENVFAEHENGLRRLPCYTDVNNYTATRCHNR